jgi:ComF family protein
MNILPQLNQKNIIKDLIHLLYPSACLVCESELIQTEQFVCSLCDSALVKTFFHLYQEATEAHFYYRKNSAIQTLLFNLKYKNNPQIGWYFGEEIGRCLIKIDALNNAEALIPVPLHYKKEFLRGYNQSMSLAKGVSAAIGVPIKKKLVKRIKNTATQTKKTRFQRWDNVDSIFSVRQSICNLKHVVLIDDVVTTGSTIETLVREINNVAPNTQVSVVTLAIA